jgi:hypothetical protein
MKSANKADGVDGYQMTIVCVEATVPGKKKTVKTYRAPAGNGSCKC